MDDFASDNAETSRRWWWIIAGVVGMTGLVIALILLLAQAGNARDEAMRYQAQSIEVIDLARSADAAIARAEAAMGRFAVSLDKNDGLMQQREWYFAGQYLDRLQSEVAGNPTQARLAVHLQAAYRERSQLVSDTVLSANAGRGLQALSWFYAASKSSDDRAIRDFLDQMVRSERELLAARIAAVDATATNFNRLVTLFSVIGGLVALAAAFSVFLMLRAEAARQLAQREVALEGERTAALEEAVASRTAELATANQNLLAEAAERAGAEARLRQAQKMEAIGQLTGGIAHDFNNMLAVVVGGIELGVRRMAETPDAARRHFDSAMDGARRASSLTRRLLAFARAEPAMPQGVPIGVAVHDFTDLIDRTIGDRIALIVTANADAGHAFVDRHQFENALLNLAVNARDAMEGVGTLTIDVARHVVGGDDPALPAGEYVAVTVTDTGCGMDAAVLDRVFDPFFTTKDVGQGTGLGMSQVFGFARQSDGDVRVRSAPGEGTSVTLLLPRQNLPAVAAVAPVPAASTARDGSGRAMTVLVVEDDPRVRAATIDAVEELGHRVIACGDPMDAEGLMAAHPDIDLILSDVLMPGMTGPEMIRRIEARWPGVAVLFVTGFTGDGTEADVFGGHEVLRKPYTLTGLEIALDKALDAQRRVAA